MQCLEFRRACAADPMRADTAFVVHARVCESCGRFRLRMLELDARILEALQVDVPTDACRAAAREPQPIRRRPSGVIVGAAGAALAAVLIATLTITFRAHLSDPAEVSLGMDIVAHVMNEPHALNPATLPLPAEAVANLLVNHGLQMAGPVGPVLYARTCLFRNRLIAHLVVRTESGPVTLLLLPDEPISGAHRITHSEFSGHIVPMGHGSAAVLSRSSPADAELELLRAVGGDV